MLPEDLKEAIVKGFGSRKCFGSATVLHSAELAYQRGREDERRERLSAEKANLDLAEAIEARSKE